MLLMKTDGVTGTTDFINTEYITGFVYNKGFNMTIIHTTDRNSWQIDGDCTQKLLEALRMSGQLKMIDLRSDK